MLANLHYSMKNEVIIKNTFCFLNYVVISTSKQWFKIEHISVQSRKESNITSTVMVFFDQMKTQKHSMCKGCLKCGNPSLYNKESVAVITLANGE